MRTFKLSDLHRASLVLLTAVILHSCATEKSKPRKKMEEFSEGNGIEGPMPFGRGSLNGSGGFAFAPSNVDLMLGGSMREFVSIALPDASNDSLAINLVNSFKPLALTLLTAWAHQQRHGLVIDLSNHSGNGIHRTDYQLEKAGDFTIPLVVIWDEQSASRIFKLKTTLAGVPSIKLSCTAGYDPANQ